MKINEKNLCAYATSPAVAADKEGYLMKKGEVNKGFQKRWFVLKGNLLFYFEKCTDREPLGVIILEGCTVELDENDAQFSFKIVFHGMGNRSYVLCADSQESMEQWMKSLARASYDYMKLMVTELQRQLKETRCKEGKTPNTDGVTKLITIEDNNPGVSCTSFVNDNYEISHSRSSSHPIATSSPHPPPRHRQNAHCRVPTSQSNVLQPSQSTSRSKSSSSLGPSGGQVTNSSFSHSWSKVAFKDVHTGFGRPVLRDRNMWRYNRKSDTSILQVNSNASESRRIIPEQNLLISL